MNLFVVGSGGGEHGGLRRIRPFLAQAAASLPGLEGRSATEWSAPDRSCVAACLTHADQQLGDVSYAHFGQDAMALFAGRPFAWTGPGEADGRGPLDPRSYLRPASEWRAALDGRYAVARWGQAAGLEVFTDALGAYPVYATEGQGGAWVSNSAGLLAALAGDEELSPQVLASFFGCGWTLSGDPVWRAVRRLGRGGHYAVSGGVRDGGKALLAAGEIGAMFSTGFSPSAAARDIAAASGALADWPGRPSEVAVTGGKDSRLSFGGALRAGFEFEGATKAFPGQDSYPETPDVVVARQLCEVTDTPHEVVLWEGERHPLRDVERANRILRFTSPGTVSLGDSFELAVSPSDGPLRLVHGGQGAESARAFFGAGEGPTGDELAERLLRRVSPGFPSRIVSGEGEQEMRSWLRGWVAEQEGSGVPPTEVPTLFHILVRLGTWAAPGLASRDAGFDTTAPLWARGILPHQLGPTASERLEAVFYPRVLDELCPPIANVPYEASKRTSRKAARELRRRLLGSPKLGPDPFPAAFARIREAVGDQPGHRAWDVLDGSRVRKILRTSPGRLDSRSRQQVLRLGTVFLP